MKRLSLTDAEAGRSTSVMVKKSLYQGRHSAQGEGTDATPGPATGQNPDLLLKSLPPGVTQKDPVCIPESTPHMGSFQLPNLELREPELPFKGTSLSDHKLFNREPTKPNGRLIPQSTFYAGYHQGA